MSTMFTTCVSDSSATEKRKGKMPVNILPKRVNAQRLRFNEEMEESSILRIVDLSILLDRSTENLYLLTLLLLHFNHLELTSSFPGYCDHSRIAMEVFVRSRHTKKNALSTGPRAMSFL